MINASSVLQAGTYLNGLLSAGTIPCRGDGVFSPLYLKALTDLSRVTVPEMIPDVIPSSIRITEAVTSHEPTRESSLALLFSMREGRKNFRFLIAGDRNTRFAGLLWVYPPCRLPVTRPDTIFVLGTQNTGPGSTLAISAAVFARICAEDHQYARVDILQDPAWGPMAEFQAAVDKEKAPKGGRPAPEDITAQRPASGLRGPSPRYQRNRS